MSQIYRSTIPRVMLIVVAVIIWLAFFTGQLASLSTEFKKWSVTVSLMMVILGILLYFTRGISHVKDKKPFWYFRGFALFVAVVYVVIGLGLGRSSAEYSWLMKYTLTPASSASWLTAFFIFVLAWHKYLHFRDVSTFMLVVGLVISTVYNIPAFAANPIVRQIGTWTYDYPATGVLRAMFLSTAVGMLMTIVRTFMGMQRSLQVKEEVTA